MTCLPAPHGCHPVPFSGCLSFTYQPLGPFRTPPSPCPALRHGVARGPSCTLHRSLCRTIEQRNKDQALESCLHGSLLCPLRQGYQSGANRREKPPSNLDREVSQTIGATRELPVRSKRTWEAHR